VGVAVGDFRERPLRSKWEQVGVQAVDLLVKAEVEPGAGAAGGPVLALEGLESGYREVKV
jgi:hypothetical protein